MKLSFKPTTFATLLALSLSTPAAAQQPSPAEKALAKGVLLEEQEHDLAGAAAAYRALAGADGPAAVRAEALLRLGKVLRRQGQAEDAASALRSAAALGTDAGRAAQALLDQDPDDAARVTALRAKAREILNRQLGEGGDRNPTAQLNEATYRDLAWIGSPAATEVCAEARTRRELGSKYIRSVPSLLRVAFSLGGEAPEQLVAAALTDVDDAWRQTVADALHTGMASPELYRLGSRFLADDEVTAMRILGDPETAVRMPVAALIGALDHPSGAVRSTTYGLLSQSWDVLAHGAAGDEPSGESVVTRIKRDLRELDPAAGAAALDFVSGRAMLQTVAGQVCFLDLVGRIAVPRGGDTTMLGWRTNVGLDGNQRVMDALQAAARRLGPVSADTVAWAPVGPKKAGDHTGSFGVRDWQLRVIHKFAEKSVRMEWSQMGRAALPAVLELLDLGYGKLGKNYDDYLVKVVGDEPLVASRLDQLFQPTNAVYELSKGSGPLPEEAWPQLKPFLAGARPELVGHAARVAGRIGHGPAVAALRELLASDERKHVEGAAAGLGMAIARGDGPDTRAAAVALVKGGYENWDAALKVLIARGAPEVEDVLGQLGTRTGGDPIWGLGRVVRAAIDPEYRAWSGFSVDQAAGLVRRCLTPDAEGSWRDVLHAITSEGSHSIPEPMSQALAEAWLNSLAAGVRQDGQILRAVVTFSPEVRASLLSSEYAAAQYWAAWSPLDLEEEHFPRMVEVAAAIRDDAGAVGSMRADTLAMTLAACAGRQGWLERDGAALLEAMMKGASPDARAVAVDQASENGLMTKERVLRALADEDSGPRRAAVKAVTTDLELASPEVVVKLLDIAASDPDSGPREAARRALDVLRTHQSQAAHWDRVFSGVEATPASAAEALLRQAKGGTPEVRLMAIKSLGTLGAPEALPFLIDWTQSKDKAVAAAALEAVQAIHRKGEGAGKGK